MVNTSLVYNQEEIPIGWCNVTYDTLRAANLGCGFTGEMERPIFFEDDQDKITRLRWDGSEIRKDRVPSLYYSSILDWMPVQTYYCDAPRQCFGFGEDNCGAYVLVLGATATCTQNILYTHEFPYACEGQYWNGVTGCVFGDGRGSHATSIAGWCQPYISHRIDDFTVWHNYEGHYPGGWDAFYVMFHYPYLFAGPPWLSCYDWECWWHGIYITDDSSGFEEAAEYEMLNFPSYHFRFLNVTGYHWNATNKWVPEYVETLQVYEYTSGPLGTINFTMMEHGHPETAVQYGWTASNLYPKWVNMTEFAGKHVDFFYTTTQTRTQYVMIAQYNGIEGFTTAPHNATLYSYIKPYVNMKDLHSDEIKYWMVTGLTKYAYHGDIYPDYYYILDLIREYVPCEFGEWQWTDECFLDYRRYTRWVYPEGCAEDTTYIYDPVCARPLSAYDTQYASYVAANVSAIQPGGIVKFTATLYNNQTSSKNVTVGMTIGGWDAVNGVPYTRSRGSLPEFSSQWCNKECYVDGLGDWVSVVIPPKSTAYVSRTFRIPDAYEQFIGDYFDVAVGLYNQTPPEGSGDIFVITKTYFKDKVFVTSAPPTTTTITPPVGIINGTLQMATYPTPTTTLTLGTNISFVFRVKNTGTQTSNYRVSFTAGTDAYWIDHWAGFGYPYRYCNDDCYLSVYDASGKTTLETIDSGKWVITRDMLPNEERFITLTYNFKAKTGEQGFVDGDVLDLVFALRNYDTPTIWYSRGIINNSMRASTIPTPPPEEGGSLNVTSYPTGDNPMNNDVVFEFRITNNGTRAMDYRLSFSVGTGASWIGTWASFSPNHYCNDYCYVLAYDEFGLTNVEEADGSWVIVKNVYPGEVRDVSLIFTLKSRNITRGQGYYHGDQVDLVYVLRNYNNKELYYSRGIIADAFRVLELPPSAEITRIIVPQTVSEDDIVDVEIWVHNNGNITSTFAIGLTMGYNYNNITKGFNGDWCNELCYEDGFENDSYGRKWVGFKYLTPDAEGKDIVKFKFRKDIFTNGTTIDVVASVWKDVRDKEVIVKATDEIEEVFLDNYINVTITPMSLYKGMFASWLKLGLDSGIDVISTSFDTERGNAKFFLWGIFTIIVGILTIVLTVKGSKEIGFTTPAWQVGLIAMFVMILIGLGVGYVPPWIGLVFIVIAGLLVGKMFIQFTGG